MNEYARVRTLIGSDATGAAVRRWARDVLAGVVDGSSELTAVRHPLGFLCFPAWRGGGLGICVHVWTEGVRDDSTTSKVHAHSWDLLSTVLYGTVGNEIIEIDSAPARPTHRLFEIQSTADGDLVRATQRLVSYRTRSREYFHSGEVYTLPNGAFHVSDVHGEAATVVLGEDNRDRPDLSLGTIATSDHWVHRTLCTPTETRRAAHTVLAHLRDQPLPKQLENRCERAT
ncbi:hypothetical protein NONI108955_06795 [Nocardia ninae]|uniref:Uncharacterized protein n=1 Tax=Nocardia ninae NBRC 108245 TaxID=1210091 RepID=A0A511MPF7_9NOCA|nr:hypothetical protein [Nocardia ninae]GEM42078.1 hypothetical protein NN4_65970 [Nocardia ninae NBRC 108245]